jgi:hypothetical protein
MKKSYYILKRLKIFILPPINDPTTIGAVHDGVALDQFIKLLGGYPYVACLAYTPNDRADGETASALFEEYISFPKILV